MRSIRARKIRNKRELEAATILQRTLKGKLKAFYYPEMDKLLEQLREVVIEEEVNDLMFWAEFDRLETILRDQESVLMVIEDERSRRAAQYAEILHQAEVTRLHQIELDKLAEQLAVAEAERLRLERMQQKMEVQLMQYEEAGEQFIREGKRNALELILMIKEDQNCKSLNKQWKVDRQVVLKHREEERIIAVEVARKVAEEKREYDEKIAMEELELMSMQMAIHDRAEIAEKIKAKEEEARRVEEEIREEAERVEQVRRARTLNLINIRI